MLLCAITDRRLLGDDEAVRCAALVALARKWTRGGVDSIQIREKDLPPAELLALTQRIVEAVREESGEGGQRTKVLLNGTAEMACAAGADGVHLPGSEPATVATEVRAAYERAGRAAVVSRSCHGVDEIVSAGELSLILYAPVFEKLVDPAGAALPGKGLDALAQACRVAGSTPVLALGGVTGENARSCVAAGAAGIAAIRLFLGEDWRSLRSF